MVDWSKLAEYIREKPLQNLNLKDPTDDVEELYNELRKKWFKEMNRTERSFVLVLGLYVFAFFLGVVMIVVGFLLPILISDFGEVSEVLGIAGIADVAFLLYKPLKEVQKSRENAYQLLAAFSEYRFVTLWTGKTYAEIYKKFIVSRDKNDVQTIELMIRLIELKVNSINRIVESLKGTVISKPISCYNELTQSQGEKKPEDTESIKQKILRLEELIEKMHPTTDKNQKE